MRLTEYSDHIRMLSLHKNGRRVLDENVDDAAVIVERLFATAEHKVDIVSGALNPRVYGRNSIPLEAKLFLVASPDHRLRIIVERGSPQDRALHPFFAECASLSNLELRKAPARLQHRYPYHFAVADASSYRYQADRESQSAIAAFGEKDGAENLASIFEELWDESEEEPVLPAPSR